MTRAEVLVKITEAMTAAGYTRHPDICPFELFNADKVDSITLDFKYVIDSSDQLEEITGGFNYTMPITLYIFRALPAVGAGRVAALDTIQCTDSERLIDHLKNAQAGEGYSAPRTIEIDGGGESYVILKASIEATYERV